LGNGATTHVDLDMHASPTSGEGMTLERVGRILKRSRTSAQRMFEVALHASDEAPVERVRHYNERLSKYS
jgi:hypothetical protein